MSKMGYFLEIGFDCVKFVEFKKEVNEIFWIFLENCMKFYKIKEFLECLVDEGEFMYYKDGYGKIIFCVYVRIDGWLVGIVVNNWEIVCSKSGEM